MPLVTWRFYRYHAAAPPPVTDASNGSGLGLSIAAEIAKLHDSDLAIESTVGCGTHITFHLPKDGVDG